MAKIEKKIWIDSEVYDILKAGGENISEIASSALSETAVRYSSEYVDRLIKGHLEAVERLKPLKYKAVRRDVEKEQEDQGLMMFLKDFEAVCSKRDFEPREFSFWYNTLAKERGYQKERNRLLPIYHKYHREDCENHFHYSGEQPNQSKRTVLAEQGTKHLNVGAQETGQTADGRLLAGDSRLAPAGR